MIKTRRTSNEIVAGALQLGGAISSVRFDDPRDLEATV
jgi:hypothetical protein